MLQTFLNHPKVLLSQYSYILQPSKANQILINKIQRFCQFHYLVDLIYHLMDSRNPLQIQGLLPKTNSLISIHQKEYRGGFLQTSATSGKFQNSLKISICIKFWIQEALISMEWCLCKQAKLHHRTRNSWQYLISKT